MEKFAGSEQRHKERCKDLLSSQTIGNQKVKTIAALKDLSRFPYLRCKSLESKNYSINSKTDCETLCETINKPDVKSNFESNKHNVTQKSITKVYKRNYNICASNNAVILILITLEVRKAKSKT